MDESPEVHVVIGVVVRNEDVPDVLQTKAGKHQLSSHPIAAIDYVNFSTGNDGLSTSRASAPRARAARSAKQEKLRSFGAGMLRCERACRQGDCAKGCQEIASA
jgi:hypothetical protein